MAHVTGVAKTLLAPGDVGVAKGRPSGSRPAGGGGGGGGGGAAAGASSPIIRGLRIASEYVVTAVAKAL